MQQIQVQKQEEKKIKYLEETYRFNFSDQKQWRNHLEKEGFVVIANWISLQDCEYYVDQFWKIMEFLSEGKVKRDDVSTQILGKNYPPVLHGGMIQYIGHSKPQWELRKRCKPLFQKLWECEDLKTSFDGFCFMNGNRNYKKTENNSFLHTDQSPTKNFLWSYQGIMTLTDAGPNGGGFVAVPKTHLYHHQYFTKKKMLNHKENWYIFTEDEKVEQPLCNDIKINTKAGDFILFDSRTFHCNAKPTTNTLRVCTYICMLPEQKVPNKIKENRDKGIKERRTSNHHAGDGFKLFPAIPRYLENPEKFKELIREVNSYDFTGDKEIMSMI